MSGNRFGEIRGTAASTSKKRSRSKEESGVNIGSVVRCTGGTRERESAWVSAQILDLHKRAKEQKETKEGAAERSHKGGRHDREKEVCLGGEPTKKKRTH